MKKIIALALALVLSLSMATVAFAAPVEKAPGDEFTLKASDFSFTYENEDEEEVVVTLIDANPYFSTDYFRIDAVKYDKGANLVESVKIDEGEVVIKLKQNYNLIDKEIVNLIVKSLNLKVTAAFKADATIAVDGGTATTDKFDFKRNMTFVGDVSTLEEVIVTHESSEVKLGKTGTDLTFGTMYNFKADVSYSDTFTADFDDVTLEFRAFDGDKLFIGADAKATKAEKELAKTNYEAELTFYNLEASASVPSGKLFFYVDEDSFIYEVNKDGKLVETNFKWSDDDNAFVGKVSTLGSYVVSDMKLKDVAKAPTDEDSKNPNTGANDFVGVAVALAVVSLVAAGAVSIKK